ncbi:MAG TPA: hypothetical protein VKR60_15020 [Candidatus Sulfotelmatobacter sp.]|nr:hypothetical protein [Candidatus Sulfotelmatobacter sp.]
MKVILGVAVLALAIIASYPVGSTELANRLLQDDINDLAAQLETRTGYGPSKSDDDYRNAVVRKATEHGIDLQPNQVTVELSGSAQESTIYLAADYSVPVSMLGFRFHLHFNPASRNSFRY